MATERNRRTQQPAPGPALTALQPDEEAPTPATSTWIDLGGSRVQVRFDNRALVELERRWGSLNAFALEMQKGEKGKLFTCVSDAIAATVRGLPIDPVDLIDPNRIVEYGEAIGAAFQELKLAERQPGQNPPS